MKGGWALHPRCNLFFDLSCIQFIMSHLFMFLLIYFRYGYMGIVLNLLLLLLSIRTNKLLNVGRNKTVLLEVLLNYASIQEPKNIFLQSSRRLRRKRR